MCPQPLDTCPQLNNATPPPHLEPVVSSTSCERVCLCVCLMTVISVVACLWMTLLLVNLNPPSWAGAEPGGCQLLSLSVARHLPLLGSLLLSERPVPSLDFRVDTGSGGNLQLAWDLGGFTSPS